jgi:lysophospholipase L1-like esterase
MSVIKSLLFWASFPFLIPQALRVRKTAPRFAPAGGPTEGTMGAGEPVRLLAIGDSIIAGVGASELSKALVGQTAAALANSRNCRVSWQALGASGYDLAKVLDRLVPQLPPEPFDYVVVSVGVNDITGLTALRAWRQGLHRLLDALRSHSPTALIAISGMPPMGVFPLLPQPLRATFGMRANTFDEAARKVAGAHTDALHVPIEFAAGPAKFADDGYHPSEESYIEYGRQVADSLLALESANRTD